MCDNDNMLARQEDEHSIIEVPLKKKKTLEVTNLKLSVFDSKNIKLVIPIQHVRSISPQKKDKIRIQFYEQRPNKIYGSVLHRRYVDYDLDQPEISAQQLCYKILQEHERINTWGKNDHGLLIMQPQEHIVITYSDVKTSKGTGLFYVTNVGLALETAEGIVFDVPYERFILVTDHKKDKIRIIWKDFEAQPDMWKHFFDFTMPKKLDRNTASSLIRSEFARYRKKIGFEFVQLEKKYGNMGYEDLYNLSKTNNPEFGRYLDLHVEHTFGFRTSEFALLDARKIFTCKLAGLNINLITNISDEEMTQRKESREYWINHNKIQREVKLHKDELERLEKTCKNADDFKKLKNSPEYTDVQKTLDDLYGNHPELENHDEVMSNILGNALTASDRRTKIIYDEWCKNMPLENFTEEYDDKWISYLLEKLNTKQGHDPIGINNMILNYEKLQEEIKIRDRNRTTLANFAAPENIPAEHIWNNCWYDEKHKIYYVQDDNLDERLQNKADSDPDHSQTMIGRRVWGFAEDQVTMFCGYPSVKAASGEEDYLDQVTVDRKTGKPLTETVYKIRNFILPILREEDINDEMAEKSGKLLYRATEIQCCIRSSGIFGWFTPKMLKLYGKRFNYAEIPIDERVRRAIFAVQCDGRFDVQAPLK